jgi:hypothetical protein
MPANFTHKNHYIDVHIIRDLYNGELFMPVVDVRPQGGHNLIKISTRQVFADKKDAEACGFELGRDWIDHSSLVTGTRAPASIHRLPLSSVFYGGK